MFWYEFWGSWVQESGGGQNIDRESGDDEESEDDFVEHHDGEAVRENG